VRFGRKLRDGEAMMISWRALCNAALIGTEVQRAAHDIGEPELQAAKEVLMYFYKTNHPEYANEDKISRIVGSFQSKAQKPGSDPWHKQMWAAYEKEGVAPRENWIKADATLKIQRIFRGARVRWVRAHARRREQEVQEEEEERARQQHTATGGRGSAGAQPRSRGGGGWRSRNAASDDGGTAGGPVRAGGDTSDTPALWSKLHGSLEGSIGIQPGSGDKVSAADREGFIVEYLDTHDKSGSGEMTFSDFSMAAGAAARSSGTRLTRSELKILFDSLAETRGGPVSVDAMAATLAQHLPAAETGDAGGGRGRAGGARQRPAFKGLRSLRGGGGDDSSDSDSDLDLDASISDLSDSSEDEKPRKKKDKKKDKPKEEAGQAPKAPARKEKGRFFGRGK
jgi:hypothetical protein